MGDKKPVPVKAPFQQQQEQKNTYGTMSVADSPEARALLDTTLDFGDYSGLSTDVDVDPGVGRRTTLAEQEVDNRYNSAFNAGVPSWIREANRAKEKREVQSQGAYEAQQAQYYRQMGQRDLEYRKAGMDAGSRQAKTLAELERRRMLLPQIVQTGGSGSTSGYGTEIVQPQPGFWQRLALGAVSGASQVGSAFVGRG